MEAAVTVVQNIKVYQAQRGTIIAQHHQNIRVQLDRASRACQHSNRQLAHQTQNQALDLAND